MKKYEYRVEVIKSGMIPVFDDSEKQAKQLNAAGAQGWELISTSVGKSELKYIYVREKQENSLSSETAVTSSAQPSVQNPAKKKKLMAVFIALGIILVGVAVAVIITLTSGGSASGTNPDMSSITSLIT